MAIESPKVGDIDFSEIWRIYIENTKGFPMNSSILQKNDVANFERTVLGDQMDFSNDLGAIPIPNLPRSPQIIRRQLCDEANCLQTIKYIFFVHYLRNPGISCVQD